MYMTDNEYFRSRVCFLNPFQYEKNHTESQSANITIVVKNLTKKLYLWDYEKWQRPMNVSEYGLSMQCYMVFFFFFLSFFS